MIRKLVVCLLTLQFYTVSSQSKCTDSSGRLISHGFHYVPGPDSCTLCVCDNGLPKACKAVLCSPPQDCRSFRVGNTCCEFICLDDVVKPVEGADANVRVVAFGATSLVLLAVAIIVYRIKKQKRRRAPHADDQRSLTSIGYISGSMGYMGGTCETALAGWKPPYLPRGEAPPPYDEVIAQCRPEAMRALTSEPYHRTYPISMDAQRTDEPCTGHSYVNITRPVQQVCVFMANTQTCYNAPLLQAVHQTESREMNPIPHHALAQNMGFPSVRLTGSLGAISSRGQVGGPREPERPHNVPGFYPSPAGHTQLHRTIPRISTALDTTILDSALSGFNRADRSLHNEIRRSFHKPNETRHLTDTGRSMPRNLNLAADEPRILMRKEEESVSRAGRSRAHSDDGCHEHNVVKPLVKSPPAKDTIAPQTLPLTVDKPSCECSYAEPAPLSEETDDYRSECENCKSASSSRWAVSAECTWAGEAAGGSLQRSAPPAPPEPLHSTLPQPVHKPRNAMGPPSNWENWFNSIPDSDTDTEEE